MKMRNEKERAINFYLESFEMVPWSALSKLDKVYYYKEADIFKTDLELERYINTVESRGEELWFICILKAIFTIVAMSIN